MIMIIISFLLCRIWYFIFQFFYEVTLSIVQGTK